MNKRQVDAITAKFSTNEDRYENLTPEEIIDYCRFALGGYIAGKGRFIYADAQSQAKFVDGQLLIKYLTTIKDRDGHDASCQEYSRIQSCGYLYTHTVGEREFLCTSEGKIYLEKNGKNFL